MPYGGNSYGALEYGGDFGRQSSVVAARESANAWWFTGPAARMLADAGFLLLVKPVLDERERRRKGVAGADDSA